MPDQFPRRTYDELNTFFSQFGLPPIYFEAFEFGFKNLTKGIVDIYCRDMTKKNVQRLNNPLSIPLLIEAVADPREFIGKEESVGDAVKYLNNFLRYDGYKLIYEGECYRVKDIPTKPDTDKPKRGGRKKDPERQEKIKELNSRYYTLRNKECFTKQKCLDILVNEFPWKKSTIETYIKK